MKTGTKIALWVTGIAVVGVGGYFIMKSLKKKREEKANEEIAKLNADKYKPIATASGKPNTAQTLYVDQTANPFPDMMSLRMFQNWVINTINDKSILGNGGANGIWDNNTAKAWAKYKDKWNALSKK